MDEIKRITKDELLEISSITGFRRDLLAKDYILTEILYLLKDLSNIYFKGGTALQKTVLRHSRLSEDIDFTITSDVKKIDAEIIKILEKSKLFSSITHDREYSKFTRIIGYWVDAERFFDYYESNGWKVGRNAMKDWKATIRTWANKDKKVNGEIDLNAEIKFLEQERENEKAE